VLHRFTAGYIRLQIFPDAYENALAQRVKACDFSRFIHGPATPMCGNTLLRFAVEFSRRHGHHIDTGQRTETPRIERINATPAASLFWCET